MTRGRKPNPTAAAYAVTLEHDVLAADSSALTEVGRRSTEVSVVFGGGETYNREQTINEACFFVDVYTHAVFELGKRLILLKEHEPHGEFVEIVEKRFRMAPRRAQEIMQAVVKFLAPSITSKARAPALLGLSKAKLLELLAEPDDHIEALADGGTLAGLDIDDITSMSSNQLRKQLRSARQDAVAKDKMISDAAAKIKEYELKSDLLERDEAEALNELRCDALGVEQMIAKMLATVDRVMSSPPTEAAELAARQTLDYVVQRLVDGCMKRGITVDLAERVEPLWRAPITAAVTAFAAGNGSKI